MPNCPKQPHFRIELLAFQPEHAFSPTTFFSCMLVQNLDYNSEPVDYSAENFTGSAPTNSHFRRNPVALA
jgi:hypothetical protein